jgi:DNA-binding transcriptional LysR family regulator
MTFTLKQIRYFAAAAECGQFSIAAERMHVSQTTITAAMRDLERDLELALFDRHHASGVSLTEDGQRFLEHARRILAAVDAALTKPGVFDRSVAGDIRLIATPQSYGLFLIAPIARFLSSYKNVTLTLEEGDGDEVQAAVLGDRADLGVLRRAVVQGQSFEVLVIAKSQRQLWMHANHPLLQSRYLSLSDLANETFVQGLSSPDVLKAPGFSPQVRYRMSDEEAVRSIVAHGMAVTMGSDAGYRPFSKEGLKIERRPVIDFPSPSEIAVITRRASALSPAVDALRSLLALYIGSEQPRPLA